VLRVRRLGGEQQDGGRAGQNGVAGLHKRPA
jgi:hypothetical protein